MNVWSYIKLLRKYIKKLINWFQLLRKAEMTTQETYKRYVVSKTHDYTKSLIYPSEINIDLPKWKGDKINGWRRCRNTDIPEQWDMKPIEVEGEGLWGPNGIFYTLYVLGYIPLSLHKLRRQDKIRRIAPLWSRWWCRLECSKKVWWWRPLWGKLTQQRARLMKELRATF